MKQLRTLPAWTKVWIAAAGISIIVLGALKVGGDSEKSADPYVSTETPASAVSDKPSVTAADIALRLATSQPGLIAATCAVAGKEGKTAGLSRFASSYLEGDIEETKAVFRTVLAYCDSPMTSTAPAETTPEPELDGDRTKMQVTKMLTSAQQWNLNKIQQVVGISDTAVLIWTGLGPGEAETGAMRVCPLLYTTMPNLVLVKLMDGSGNRIKADACDSPVFD